MDLNKRITLQHTHGREFCEKLEDATTLYKTLKNVPWERFSLTYAMSLYPFECSGELIHSVLTLKLSFPQEWAFFDWLKIARAIISSEVEQYLSTLASLYGIRVDAVDIVG